VAVRERFWISEPRRYEALIQLSGAEGIQELIVMATCNRTEFWLWATDVTALLQLGYALAGRRIRAQSCVSGNISTACWMKRRCCTFSGSQPA